MTVVASCCAVAIAASVVFAMTANTADANSSHRSTWSRRQVLADAAFARALVPVASREGVARDPLGRATSTRLSRAVAAKRVADAAARGAKRAADARAFAAAAEAASARSADDAVWDRLARCETGGNWSLRGSRYSGGLGFYNGTWDAFGGREFASNAGMATREQQITVARRVRARFGYTGWGCAPHVGLGRSTMS